MLTLQYRENNLNTANLYLDENRRTSRISKLRPCVVSLTGLFDPERQRVEGFIKAIFKKSYNADIQVEYPILMNIRNADGDILAALGFRYAGKSPLFLEQYTGRPVDKILNCLRGEIVEIGNLASAGHGASAFLFAALASYLNNKNIRYAAITGTDFLHRYFKKMGFDPCMICDADIAAIQEDGQSWGRYYDTQPRVLVGSLETAVKRLRSILGAEFEDCHPRMLPRLQSQQCEVAL